MVKKYSPWALVEFTNSFDLSLTIAVPSRYNFT